MFVVNRFCVQLTAIGFGPMRASTPTFVRIGLLIGLQLGLEYVFFIGMGVLKAARMSNLDSWNRHG